RNHPISLCEISAHPERFAGKVVRVRALITRDVVVGGPEKIGPSEVSAFSACTGKKEWAEAYVTLDEVSGVSLQPNIQVWKSRTDVTSFFYLTEGVIVGRFEPHDDGITRCFTPRFELADARLESASSTTTVNREDAVAWVQSKSQ